VAFRIDTHQEGRDVDQLLPHPVVLFDKIIDKNGKIEELVLFDKNGKGERKWENRRGGEREGREGRKDLYLMRIRLSGWYDDDLSPPIITTTGRGCRFITVLMPMKIEMMMMMVVVVVLTPLFSPPPQNTPHLHGG